LCKNVCKINKILVFSKACLAQNTVGQTVPILYTRLYTGCMELQPCLGMSWYDLDSNVARVCTNKARIYSAKQGVSRFEHDLQTIFIRLLYGSKYGLLRPSTIKHDFLSINWIFAGFMYGPTDFCSSYARIITHSCMF
jgi:hypothetical protein